MATTPVTLYLVMYSANGFGPRVTLMNGPTTIGQLVFEPDDTNLPLDKSNDGHVTLYYHQRHFANVLDLLRNERPIFLVFNGSGKGFENGIQTTREAVGAGER